MKQERKTKQLFILFIIFSMILSFTNIVIYELFFGHQIEKIALDNAVNQTKEREGVFKNMMQEHALYLKSIRDMDIFNKYLNNPKIYEKKFTDFLMTFAKAKQSLMQLRYLDKNGMEKIRIDRSFIDSEPFLLSKDVLQNKANRYYFMNSKEKDKFENVWFSALDLNIEKGKVEIPYKPTLRAMLPIKHENKFNGVLIINIFMKDFLDGPFKTPMYDMILADKQGYILKHYNTKKDWGAYKKEKYTLSEDFPQEYKNILSNELLHTDKFVSRKLILPTQNSLYLILQLKKSYIEQQNQLINQNYIAQIVIILIFSLILSAIMTRFFHDAVANMEILQKLNKSLNKAQTVAKLGIWEMDVIKDKLYWSDETYSIFELDKDLYTPSYKNFLFVLHPDDREKVNEAYMNSLKTKESYEIVHRLLMKDGRIKYVREKCDTTFDNEGTPLLTFGTVQDITELTEKQNKLSESYEKLSSLSLKLEDERYKYKKLLELASDAVFITDTKGYLLEYSKKTMQLLGYSKEEMENMCVFDWDVNLTEKENKSFLEKLKRGTLTIERKYKRKDGTIYDAQITAKYINLHKKTYIYMSARDITEIKNLESQLIKERDFALSVINKSTMVLLTNGEEATYANKALLNFFKCKDIDEFKDKHQCICHHFLHNENYFHLGKIEDKKKWIFELKKLPPDKRNVALASNKNEIKIFSVMIKEYDSKHYIICFNDISETMLKQLELEQQIMSDKLTNAYSREYFDMNIDQILNNHYIRNTKSAVVMLDIDHFKKVNDTFGHHVGDLVLKTLVKVIKEHSRQDDILIRWGGEEFIMIMAISNQDALFKILENLRKIIEEASFPEVQTITCSFGATYYQENESIETTIKRADQAMYESKNSGRNKVSIIS